jgi:hypothetical protein
MKVKLNLETFVYGLVVVLCLTITVLIWASSFQFTDTKPVYQGF